MPISLTVLYPTEGETTFDHAYYASTHMGLVGEHFGPHMVSATASKGLAGGAGAPPGYHAVANIVFEDQSKLDAAMGAGGPVLADIPNYYNGLPQILIGEVIG
ncbi:MAG: EthD family reductase [Arenibacterium sp.]